MVDVEEHALRTLEQHPTILGNRGAQRASGVDDARAQLLAHRDELLEQIPVLLGRLGAERREDRILLREQAREGDAERGWPEAAQRSGSTPGELR